MMQSRCFGKCVFGGQEIWSAPRFFCAKQGGIFLVGKKHILLLLVLVLSVCLPAGLAEETQPLEELWKSAMADAVFSEDDEVFELVCLTQDDPQVIWDDSAKRVLLLTWHDYAQDCAPGEALEYEEIWASSLGEMENWFRENGAGVTDWDLRFAQLLGLPEDAGYTRFTAFWVSPEEVIRPAYVPDVTAQMVNDYGKVTDPEYKAWFDANILYSYFESEYPWTRLGYTYDWSGAASPYGLTEFLVMDADNTQILFTCSTQEFVDWLEAQPSMAE